MLLSFFWFTENLGVAQACRLYHTTAAVSQWLQPCSNPHNQRDEVLVNALMGSIDLVHWFIPILEEVGGCFRALLVPPTWQSFPGAFFPGLAVCLSVP